MQAIVDVPETLPEETLQKLLKQFERRLKKEAQHLQQVRPQASRWVQIAREAHDESPLQGLSAHVLTCSHEIRDNFEFRHDEEPA